MAANNFAVLTKVGDDTFAEALLSWEPKANGVDVVKRGGETASLPTDKPASPDVATGRLNFTSEGVEYFIRELREDDGEWLSSNKTLLPQRALQALISGDNVGTNLNNPDDQVVAYSLDDSAYVLGVVYTNAAGRWSRVGGDWRMLAPTDHTFDGMSVSVIDPERADDFIDLYDTNFVSTTDAEAYEVDEDPAE